MSLKQKNIPLAFLGGDFFGFHFDIFDFLLSYYFEIFITQQIPTFSLILLSISKFCSLSWTKLIKAYFTFSNSA